MKEIQPELIDLCNQMSYYKWQNLEKVHICIAVDYI